MALISENDLSNPRVANVLLAAYKERVIDELLKELLADIRPKLAMAARLAGDALELQMAQHVDRLSRDLLVKLDISIDGNKLPTTEKVNGNR